MSQQICWKRETFCVHLAPKLFSGWAAAPPFKADQGSDQITRSPGLQHLSHHHFLPWNLKNLASYHAILISCCWPWQCGVPGHIGPLQGETVAALGVVASLVPPWVPSTSPRCPLGSPSPSTGSHPGSVLAAWPDWPWLCSVLPPLSLFLAIYWVSILHLAPFSIRKINVEHISSKYWCWTDDWHGERRQRDRERETGKEEKRSVRGRGKW